MNWDDITIEEKIKNKQIIVRHYLGLRGDVTIKIFNTITKTDMEVKYYPQPKSMYETVDFAKVLSIHLRCDVQFFEEQTTWLRTDKY